MFQFNPFPNYLQEAVDREAERRRKAMEREELVNYEPPRLAPDMKDIFVERFEMPLPGDNYAPFRTTTTTETPYAMNSTSRGRRETMRPEFGMMGGLAGSLIEERNMRPAAPLNVNLGQNDRLMFEADAAGAMTPRGDAAAAGMLAASESPLAVALGVSRREPMPSPQPTPMYPVTVTTGTGRTTYDYPMLGDGKFGTANVRYESFADMPLRAALMPGGQFDPAAQMQRRFNALRTGGGDAKMALPPNLAAVIAQQEAELGLREREAAASFYNNELNRQAAAENLRLQIESGKYDRQSQKHDELIKGMAQNFMAQGIPAPQAYAAASEQVGQMTFLERMNEGRRGYGGGMVAPMTGGAQPPTMTSPLQKTQDQLEGQRKVAKYLESRLGMLPDTVKVEIPVGPGKSIFAAGEIPARNFGPQQQRDLMLDIVTSDFTPEGMKILRDKLLLGTGGRQRALTDPLTSRVFSDVVFAGTEDPNRAGVTQDRLMQLLQGQAGRTPSFRPAQTLTFEDFPGAKIEAEQGLSRNMFGTSPIAQPFYAVQLPSGRRLSLDYEGFLAGIPDGGIFDGWSVAQRQRNERNERIKANTTKLLNFVRLLNE